MATVIYAICSVGFWGTPDWGGKVSEAARDAYYDGTYTSVSAWESARDGVAANGDTEIAEIVSDDWTTTAEGVLNWDILGWTNVPAEIKVIGLGASRHDGIYGNVAEAYVNERTLALDIDVTGAAITLEGFQIFMSGAQHGMAILPGHDAGNVLIDSIILKGSAGAQRCIRADGDSLVNIFNTVIFDEWDQGVRREGGTCNVFNCTISTAGHGSGSRGSNVVKNCAVFNNAANDDFILPGTVDYCASDDGDGDHPIDISPGGVEADDWNDAFTDYANGDFTLKNASSVLYDSTNGDVSGGAFSDDIVGTERSQGNQWDIGAFELIVAVGGIVQQSTAYALRHKKAVDGQLIPGVIRSRLKRIKDAVFKRGNFRKGQTWAYS